MKRKKKLRKKKSILIPIGDTYLPLSELRKIQSEWVKQGIIA